MLAEVEREARDDQVSALAARGQPRLSPAEHVPKDAAGWERRHQPPTRLVPHDDRLTAARRQRVDRFVEFGFERGGVQGGGLAPGFETAAQPFGEPGAQGIDQYRERRRSLGCDARQRRRAGRTGFDHAPVRGPARGMVREPGGPFGIFGIETGGRDVENVAAAFAREALREAALARAHGPRDEDRRHAATLGGQGTGASGPVSPGVFASRTLRFAGVCAALAGIVLASLALGLFVGGSALAPRAVAGALLHPRDGGDVATIVWSLRLPRVAIGAFVGLSLAVSGMLLQGLLRNPLVDPFLTGVSAGAAAAIAVAVACGVAAPLVPGLGFAAGLGTALLVAFLARRGSGLDAERLILAGVSLSALFSAIVTLALLRLGRASSDQVLAWLAGSLAGRGWTELAATVPYGLAGLALAALAVPALSAMRLGASVARAVGVDLARTQWLVLGAATLLAASAVTLSGVVGFVGLIVPHLARRLVGSDARRVIVASALLGAAFVPLADALARSLAPPMEIPLGVLLAFVGVPSFLYLYLRPANATRLWGT